MPVGIASSRSSVPEERSRSVVTLGHQEHHDERDEREQRRPEPVEGRPASASNIQRSSARIRHGQHQQHRERAVVVAQLAQHPDGDGQGDPGAHACSLRSSTRREERVLDVGGAGARRAAPAGVSSAMQPPLAHEQQPVAALGLVHDVAGRRARQRPRRPAGGTAPTGPGAAPGRARRWARRAPARSGAPSSATARLDPADRCPPESVPTTRSACAGRGRPAPATRSHSSGPTPSTRAKKRRFSADGQVVVHARRLGDVADPVPQPGAARPGGPSTVHGSRRRPPARRRPSASACSCRSRSARAARYLAGRRVEADAVDRAVPPRTTRRSRTSTAGGSRQLRP